jgi:hypothetical protein
MSTENRHRIEPWRVAAMLLLTFAAAVSVFYILTDPSRAVAAWYTIGFSITGMAVIVRDIGP